MSVFLQILRIYLNFPALTGENHLLNNMMSRKRQFIFCFFFYIDFATGFFGSSLKDGNYKTKSHTDITVTGTFRAIEKYIINKKGKTSIEDFFKDDSDGKWNMTQLVVALGKAVAETQENRKDTAYIHCHADQINLAHNFVKSCKQKLENRKNDRDELRRQLGECLYTIQSFYSNTNYVEMNGEKVYEDFGVNDLMEIATPDDDTCLDMISTETNCANNLINNGKLTSGYHHGRGNTKPSRPQGSSRGKCSHGGPEDTSKELIAKCGINKDSVSEQWSPHYHLHIVAYRSAVAATEHFLIADGHGLLSVIGGDIFDALFHVKARKPISLAFAVDYSGSMSDDIAQVKKTIIDLVTSSVGSPNGPADYVLSLFNDPEYLTKSTVYTNGFEMITSVGNIVVNGGGDCPEYAAAGILNATEHSRIGSTVFTFTDASAKDEHRIQEVIIAAVSKNITLTSLLTGKCARRKKREITGKSKRQTSSFFQQIAEATGGTVYNTNTTDLGNILSKVLEDIFPSTEVIIDSFDWSSSTTGAKSVFVDSYITGIKIHIVGTSAKTDVDIVYANGTIDDFTSATSRRIQSSTNGTVISLQNPPPGSLNIRRNLNRNWKVNITAQSSLKVDGALLEVTSDGNVVNFEGSPVLGNNYSVWWTVYNLRENGTCNKISLVDTEGTTITSYNTTMHRADYGGICSAHIEIPDKNFQLTLDGNDGYGYRFFRKLSNVYQPSSVKLVISDSLDDAIIGKTRMIDYEMTNVGNIPKTYSVSIKDNYGFAVLPTTHSHSIGAGYTGNGTFTLRPTTPSVIFSYLVAVTDVNTGQLQQIFTKKLVVTDVERPVCSILSTTGTCGPPSLNTANCSLYFWTSAAEVTFSGTQIISISSSAGSAVTLSHENVTSLLKGPMSVNISGNCCYPSLDVSIIDNDGFIAQCKLDLSTGGMVVSVKGLTTDLKDIVIPVGLVAGVVSATVIVIVALIVLRYYCYHKSTNSQVTDSTVNLHSGNRTSAWTDIGNAGGQFDKVQKPKFREKSLFIRNGISMHNV